MSFLSDLFSWHEALPNIGEFFNRVGFPMGVWLVTVFILYRVFYGVGYKALAKLWNKIEPIIDAHFDLVVTMKDNLSKQTDIMSQTNNLIKTKFDEQNNILTSHSDKLEEIMKVNTERNQILQQNGKAHPFTIRQESVSNVSKR